PPRRCWRHLPVGAQSPSRVAGGPGGAVGHLGIVPHGRPALGSGDAGDRWEEGSALRRLSGRVGRPVGPPIVSACVSSSQAILLKGAGRPLLQDERGAGGPFRSAGWWTPGARSPGRVYEGTLPSPAASVPGYSSRR